ncbi:hypothetical protein CPB86DRAFT_772310 [Serendipita vermifera]|nr:hypothetical protein CPB86DRAFT_772310 [Serendipita vermifera]
MDSFEIDFLTPIDPNKTSSILSSPPFIKVDGAANFRDVGNLKASFHTHHTCYQTRPKFIFRSAQMSHLRPTGLQTLESLNIRAVFDLRSDCEIQAYRPKDTQPGSPYKPADLLGSRDSNIQVYQLPIMPASYFHPSQVKKRLFVYDRNGEDGLLQEYEAFLDNAGYAFGTIFRYISDPKTSGTGLLVHCAIGKDRTGLFIALLLMLVGVSDEDICYDYSLSRVGLEPIRSLILSHMTESREVIASMMSSSTRIIRQTLDLIRSKYGGAEGYLSQKCGLSTEDFDAVRRAVLIPCACL